jgi:hypothetical protein
MAGFSSKIYASKFLIFVSPESTNHGNHFCFEYNQEASYSLCKLDIFTGTITPNLNPKP